MSYVLGFITADGAIEDVRRSSRTCYTAISSVDKSIIQKVKAALKSNHKIYEVKPRLNRFRHRSYFCRKIFILRIGSKAIFQNLVDLGLTPRKSLRLRLPDIPRHYFRDYLRGYFDGDGCIHVSTKKGTQNLGVAVIFTSGSKQFLDSLSKKLMTLINTSAKKINFDSGAYRLRFRKKDGLKILSFMYRDMEDSIYLKRKYKIYKDYLARQ